MYKVHTRASLDAVNGTIQRRGTLQRIKTRIMSLTSNPNYGISEIKDGNGDDNIIDLRPKQVRHDEQRSLLLQTPLCSVHWILSLLLGGGRGERREEKGEERGEGGREH